MRKTSPVIFLCAFIAISLGLLASPVEAKNKADIVDIQIKHDPKSIEVSFLIENCFTQEMDEAILSGVETTFRILLVLEKDGFLFFRNKVLNIALEHTIKYDRLNGEFQVILPEHPNRVLSTADFNQAKDWMSNVKDLSLIPTWRLSEDTEYKVRLKAELSKVRLPLFFRYVFYFVSLWDFETGWSETTFNL